MGFADDLFMADEGEIHLTELGARLYKKAFDKYPVLEGGEDLHRAELRVKEVGRLWKEWRADMIGKGETCI